MKKFIPLLLLLLSITAQAKIILYTANDGLCNNYVTGIIKDSRGIMWIGSKNGLSRYDGYTFTEQPGLQNIGINNLLYDPVRNVIWVGTNEDGLYKIDPTNFNEEHIKLNGADDTAPIQTIFLQPDGSLYFTFRSGPVYRIDPTNHVQALSIHSSPLLCNMPEGSGPAPLFLINSKKHQEVKEYQHNGELKTLLQSSEKIKMLNRYQNLLIYTLSDNNIYAWHIIEKQFKHFPSAQQSGSLVYLSIQDDNLYTIYKGKAPIKTSLINGSATKISLEDDEVLKHHTTITCIYTDEQDNTWIGSDRGLFKIFKSKNAFETILASGPPSISTRAILKDENDNMYVGTYQGLYHQLPQSGLWQTYTHYVSIPEKKELVAPYSLLNDTAGFLYFGSWAIPFGKFHKKTKTFETIVPYDKLNNFHIALALLRNENGEIWIGTNCGLYVYNPLNKKTQCFSDSIPELKTTTIKVLQKRIGGTNEIWVGTNNGLYLIHPEKGILHRFHTSSKPALSDNEILCIENDRQQNTWIGTNGGGINIINKSLTSIHFLRKVDGLCDNVIYSFMWQDDNRLWAGTSHGLSCYDKTQNAFVNYYMRDGLSDNDFDHNSFFKDKDGKMFFGGINGINAFYPDSLRKTNKPFSLFLSSFTKWDNNEQSFISVHHLTGNSDVITLNPYDHSPSFTFALSDYTNPENNTYFFRIANLYTDWVSLNHQNMLRLDGLNSGSHIIEIKALNASGIPASNILTFDIVIKQPFYKTTWFFALVLLCIGALGYILFYIKVDNLKKLQTLRTQIASTLHDEMGSLLTMIATFADSVRFSINSETEKNSKLERISDLSRKANATMNDTLWSIDSRNDYTLSLIDRMREHAENMLLPNNIELQFKFDSVSHEQKISPEIRQELLLIYKEAINNVVKHGSGKYAKISFLKTGKNYSLTIENGCDTREINTSGSGQGLRNIRMRAKRIDVLVEIFKRNNIFAIEISKIGNT